MQEENFDDIWKEIIRARKEKRPGIIKELTVPFKLALKEYVNYIHAKNKRKNELKKQLELQVKNH